MPKMIQVRNVPTALHRQAKARAAAIGMTLSDFVLREIKRALERPTREEILERVARRKKPTLGRSPSAVLREERESQ